MSHDNPWTETRRECLRLFCDTLFPALAVSPDPHGFFQRSATAIGVHLAVAHAVENSFTPTGRAGVFALLDSLSSLGFATVDQLGREHLLLAVQNSSPAATVGVTGIIRIAIALCYTLPDLNGRNPNWDAIGYPGPLRAAPPTPKPITPFAIEQDEVTLDADVCVVGSGAGGGVIAGELARRGLSVIVLEAGGYYNESDFNHLELWSHRNLYWRGGYVPTLDDTVRILAGGTLGGGTQINWENCLRTPDWVRAEWAREYGLDGVDGPEFDRALDRVFARFKVNDQCSDLNGPHLRFEAGARRLGYAFERTFRNIDADKYDPETAGFHGYGDITGSRQSTANTYLVDAFERGARILVRTRAERITTAAGRATGVEARATRADGRPARVTVRAPRVIAACGALETPALLLRSNLGGPAAGLHLRLHPALGLTARYGEDQASWWGPPQAAVCRQFERRERDYGFLIEGTHHSLSLTAASLPWRSGREHKMLMAESGRLAQLIAIVRDQGSGRVTVDANGNSQPFYPLEDRLDLDNLLRGAREVARLHEAAGAELIRGSGRLATLEWERGGDLDAWLSGFEVSPKQANPIALFSAHQMGSARMGRDPSASVAQPSGELHDVKGVWIGDTSAFPSACGVNPMITCMALATRTAERIR